MSVLFHGPTKLFSNTLFSDTPMKFLRSGCTRVSTSQLKTIRHLLIALIIQNICIKITLKIIQNNLNELGSCLSTFP